MEFLIFRNMVLYSLCEWFYNLLTVSSFLLLYASPFSSSSPSSSPRSLTLCTSVLRSLRAPLKLESIESISKYVLECFASWRALDQFRRIFWNKMESIRSIKYVSEWLEAGEYYMNLEIRSGVDWKLDIIRSISENGVGLHENQSRSTLLFVFLFCLLGDGRIWWILNEFRSWC